MSKRAHNNLPVILRESGATEESQRPFAVAQGDKKTSQGDKIIFQGDNGEALLKTYYKEL
jgi:hypothetical protein